MKCLIIGKDEKYTKKVNYELEKVLKKHISNYSIKISSDFFNEQILNYDIFFIDLDMCNNVFRIVQHIRKSEMKYYLIIFLSSIESQLFELFILRPFCFIRKSNFEHDIKNFTIQLSEYLLNDLRFFTFNYYGKKTCIYCKDIQYIESYGHEIAIVTKDNHYEYRSSLKEVLSQLEAIHIVQIQRSLAITIRDISFIEGNNVYMKSGKSYSIGKKYKKELLNNYKLFLEKI